MMDIDVRSNVKEFTRQLNRWERREIPFATAVSLTRTAQVAQEWLQANIPKTFNVTKKWWAKGQPTGVKIKGANKQTLQAMVYCLAHFAEIQETGGIKVPKSHKGILTPTETTPRYGRKSGGAAKLMAGKKILRKGGRARGSPVIKMPNGHRGVFRRRGKKRLPLDKLYSYTPIAAVPMRWGFRDKAERVARAKFDEIFSRELQKALGYSPF